MSTETMALRYSAVPLWSSMGLLSPAAISPALTNRDRLGISPINVFSASLALIGTGATAPKTIRADWILPSGLSSVRKDATLTMEISRARRVPSLM